MGNFATSGYKYCACPTCFFEVVGSPTSPDFCSYCDDTCDTVGECAASEWDDHTLELYAEKWEKEDTEG
jgi:hypothetical protein